MESSYGQDFHFAILASIDYISKRVRWRRFFFFFNAFHPERRRRP